MASGMAAELRERLREGNRREYGEGYGRLHFPVPAEAARAQERRRDLLEALAERVAFGCDGPKLDCTALAPGCRICAEGGWSCLFISGRCNCRCFYCPTSQEEIGVPATNTVEFRTPADYVAYLERFGFSGASISGGEPLLTPRRTLAFVSAVKRRFGAAMHLWLYTNGTLADAGALAQLRDAGLDEIRFDIGAVGYRLDGLRRAELDPDPIRQFGAEGIGLCRTEHMCFDEKRINVFREMIVSNTDADRLKALRQLKVGVV